MAIRSGIRAGVTISGSIRTGMTISGSIRARMTICSGIRAGVAIRDSVRAGMTVSAGNAGGSGDPEGQGSENRQNHEMAFHWEASRAFISGITISIRIHQEKVKGWV